MKKTVILALCAALLVALPTLAQERKHAAGFVTDYEGDCRVVPSDGAGQKVRLGMFVYERDTVSTGKRSTVKIIFANGVETRVRQNSELSIVEIPPAERGVSSKIKMVVGGIFSRVVKQKTKFDINTPAVTIAVRGTEFDTDVSGDGSTEVRVFKGKVALVNEFGSRNLDANTKSSVSPGSPPSPPTALETGAKKPAEEERQYALEFGALPSEMPENASVTAIVSVKDADGLLAGNFKNKISVNASAGVLISPHGRGKWTDTVEESPSGGELKFDIKAAAGGAAIVSAVSKTASSASAELKILRPKKRALKLKMKEGGAEREIKIQFKEK